jgi:hypothetical protein
MTEEILNSMFESKSQKLNFSTKKYFLFTANMYQKSLIYFFPAPFVTLSMEKCIHETNKS